MKKKLLVGAIIFLVIAGLFSLTGCGKKKETDNSQKQAPQESQTVDETLVKINNQEFNLNQDDVFKDIKFTIVPDFKKSEFEHYVQYNYLQDGSSNLLYFRVFYYEGQDNNTAIKDLGLDSDITLSDGKTDNIEYKIYEKPRDDGGTIHFYFINHEENTYVLHFVSKYDIKDFESKVVKSVKF